MDCSPPGSSVRGIFQARMLEWYCHCPSVPTHMSGASAGAAKAACAVSLCSLLSSKRPAHACSQDGSVSTEEKQSDKTPQGLASEVTQCCFHHILLVRASHKAAWIQEIGYLMLMQIKTDVATMENIMEVKKKLKIEPSYEKIYDPLCSKQHYLQ